MQYFLVAAFSGFLILCSFGTSRIGETDDEVSWQHDQRLCILHVLMQHGGQLAVNPAVRDKSKVLTKGRESSRTGRTITNECGGLSLGITIWDQETTRNLESCSNSDNVFHKIVFKHTRGCQRFASASVDNVIAPGFTNFSARLVFSNANRRWCAIPTTRGSCMTTSPEDGTLALEQRDGPEIPEQDVQCGDAVEQVPISGEPELLAYEAMVSIKSTAMLQISNRKKKWATKVAPIEEGSTWAVAAEEGNTSEKASMSSKVAPVKEGNTSAIPAEEGSISGKTSMSMKEAPREKGSTSAASAEEGNTVAKASTSKKVAPIEEGNSWAAAALQGMLSKTASKKGICTSMAMVMSMAVCMACAAAMAMAMFMPMGIWFLDGHRPERRQEAGRRRRVSFAGDTWDMRDTQSSVLLYRPL